MITIKKKAVKKGAKAGKKRGTAFAKSVKTRMMLKRKQAIEKAIVFWERHSIDLSGFKFDREEANAR